MWVFIATEVLLFGGLMLSYFVYRHAYPQAFMAASRHTDILIGTANTAILLTSSFLVACAVEALSVAGAHHQSRAADRRGHSRPLVSSSLKGIEYADEYREHLIPGINFSFDGPLADGVQLFFVFYFVATALHALHMLVGIGLLTIFAVRIRNAEESRTRAALHSAALYWHFVDVVWIFLFALIYLAGKVILMERWRPSVPLVASWLGLLALLALTVTLAYQPLGAFNAVAALGIGATKALIVAAVFMELRHRGPRTLIFAAAGLFWLAILLWLGSMDFLTRT